MKVATRPLAPRGVGLPRSSRRNSDHGVPRCAGSSTDGGGGSATWQAPSWTEPSGPAAPDDEETQAFSAELDELERQLREIEPKQQRAQELKSLLAARDRRDEKRRKHAQELACSKRYNVIHLIYAAKEHEGPGKDIQFGPSTMRDHWGSGLTDIRESLSHPEWLAMPDDESGFVTHDIHRHPHAERRSKRL